MRQGRSHGAEGVLSELLFKCCVRVARLARLGVERKLLQRAFVQCAAAVLGLGAERASQGDRAKPGVKGSGVAEVANASQGVQHGILGDLAREVRVAEDRPGDGGHDGEDVADEGVLRIRGAGAIARCQTPSCREGFVTITGARGHMRTV